MISIDYTTIFVILNFVLLLIVLNKLLYKPINKFLAERKQKISEDMDAAKKSREEAQQFVSQKEEELKKSSEEVRGLKKKAAKDAEKQASEIVKAAMDREKKILGDTEELLQNEKSKVLQELSNELSGMVSELTAKFVSESMQDADDQKLIKKMLAERSEK
ncbi:MAG: F0F1 ATP synthase subunit B [Candidatus Cloacimonadales bacterium]